MDKKRPLTPLSQVLEEYLASSGLGKGVERAEVVQRWPDLVGPQIAAVTQAESVSADGVLRVRVATAPWATELSLMTPRILARVNAGRQGRINSIRWIAWPLDRASRPGSEDLGLGTENCRSAIGRLRWWCRCGGPAGWDTAARC